MCDKCDWGILLYCILHLCIREITTKNNVFGFIYINRFHDKKKQKANTSFCNPLLYLLAYHLDPGKVICQRTHYPMEYIQNVIVFRFTFLIKKSLIKKGASVSSTFCSTVRLSSHGTWYALFLLIWQKAHVNFSDQDLSAVCRLCRRRCCYKLFHIFIFFRTTKSISTQLHTKHHWVMWIEL